MIRDWETDWLDERWTRLQFRRANGWLEAWTIPLIEGVGRVAVPSRFVARDRHREALDAELRNRVASEAVRAVQQRYGA